MALGLLPEAILGWFLFCGIRLGHGGLLLLRLFELEGMRLSSRGQQPMASPWVYSHFSHLLCWSFRGH